jgi:geranylgeranyl reductase family protein
MIYDIIVVGGGPAGASCAAFASLAGLRVLVLERETFPREKVCGDCINPACWEILDRLGLNEQVHGLGHGRLDAVEFISIGGTSVRVNLPVGARAEIAVKRSLFDELLLQRAANLGATVRQNETVTVVEKTEADTWRVRTAAETFEARTLVGADGRNSTVARLRNLMPRPQRERVALQAHIPCPQDFGNRVVLQFLPEGYSGQAPVGDGQLNLCLVSRGADIHSLKEWALRRFHLSPEQTWRTITPLTRAPIHPAHNNLFFIGDTARVVEPFTGEGIYYALASGELAARAIVCLRNGDETNLAAREFSVAHAALYRGRLWINRLARAAVLSPRIASIFVHAARWQPSILRMLTSKIVG